MMSDATHSGVSSKQAIVVSFPGKNELDQYNNKLQDIAAFFSELDQKTASTNDDLFIIHDDTAVVLSNYTFPNSRFIRLPVGFDLWMRDFPTAIPEQPVKFKFRPDYVDNTIAKRIDDSFCDFLTKTLQVDNDITWSDIVLDGGNIVENGVDKALITERVLFNNPNIKREVLKARIESALNRQVAFLPDPGSSTGHADEFVSFLESDVLLMCNKNDTLYDLAVAAVHNEFPSLTVTPLPCYVSDATFMGFSSAEGFYANSLVTFDNVYVPMFSDDIFNVKALDVIKANTNKKVVTVDNSKLGMMGGNVRCMTWQLDADHPAAKALYNLAANQKSPTI